MNALQIVGGTDYEEKDQTAQPVPKTDFSEPDAYWLNNVPEMTFILVQQANARNPSLAMFCVKQRIGPRKATELVTAEGTRHWFDPKDFSRMWNHHTTLLTAEQYHEMDKAGALEDEETEHNLHDPS